MKITNFFSSRVFLVLFSFLVGFLFSVIGLGENSFYSASVIDSGADFLDEGVVSNMDWLSSFDVSPEVVNDFVFENGGGQIIENEEVNNDYYILY